MIDDSQRDAALTFMKKNAKVYAEAKSNRKYLEAFTKTLRARLYYDKHGKIPTDYIAQLQMQLFVSEREWVYIFYYSKYLPCLVVRQYPDPVIQSALKTQLMVVIAERNLILRTLEKF